MSLHFLHQYMPTGMSDTTAVTPARVPMIARKDSTTKGQTHVMMPANDTLSRLLTSFSMKDIPSPLLLPDREPH